MIGLWNKKMHVSWHIAAASAGLLVGSALALVVPYWVFYSAAWLAVAAVFLFIVLIKKLQPLIIFAVAGGMLIGLWQGSNFQELLQQYKPFLNQKIVLQGKVTDDTTYGPNGDQRLKLSNIKIGDKNLVGQAWVSTVSSLQIKRGDIVSAQGRLGEGFGTMPASMFRAEIKDVIRPEPGDIARVMRDWFASSIRQAIPEPEAGLGIGYLVGQRGVLPEDLTNQLRILGLTHIIVASGYQLTILVSVARRIFARFSKYMAAFVAGSLIFSFLLLTGFSTSITRAALVSGLSLLAWYYGRVVHPVVLLLLVAAITVFVDPSLIWGDIGWYLSFTAFVGVIILAPLLHHYFSKSQKQGIFSQILIATIAAQITTFPIIAFTFEQYSPLALVSNLLILPLVPIAMLLTFLGGLAGLFLPALAQIFGFPAYAVLKYMTHITQWLASLPWAQGEIVFNTIALIISYVVLLLLIIYLKIRTGHKFGEDSVV